MKYVSLVLLVALLVLGFWVYRLSKRATGLQGEVAGLKSEVSRLQKEKATVTNCVSSLHRRGMDLNKSHFNMKLALMNLHAQDCSEQNLFEIGVYADSVSDDARDVTRIIDDLDYAISSGKYEQVVCW